MMPMKMLGSLIIWCLNQGTPLKEIILYSVKVEVEYKVEVQYSE